MLHIYGVPISVHTRKVIVAAIEKNLPYQLTAVVPVIPGNPPPNWRTFSPTGLIPVLTDGDFTQADSAAICAYLERAYPTQALYPADVRVHAQTLFLEQYAGGTIFRDVVHPLFHEVVVNPNIKKVPSDAAKVNQVLANTVPEVFGYLESVAGDGFLVGSRMTIADVAVVSNLITFQYIGFALDRSRYPKLSAWFKRVIAQPAMQKSIQNEQNSVASMGLDNQCVRGVLP